MITSLRLSQIVLASAAFVCVTTPSKKAAGSEVQFHGTPTRYMADAEH